MILLIDWGNTRLKYCLLDELTEDALAYCTIYNVADLNALKKQKFALDITTFESVQVASVRSKQDNQALMVWLQTKSKQVLFAKTAAQASGIDCAYAEPSTLGIDRWLGILAGAKNRASFGVISIGTAVTLDLVIDKKHLGGHILPGRQLMFDSLFKTGQVRPQPAPINQSSVLLGQTTTQCVNYAIDASLIGYLQHTLMQLEKQYPVAAWLITGGGAEAIVQQLKCVKAELLLKEALVFEGLLEYVRE